MFHVKHPRQFACSIFGAFCDRVGKYFTQADRFFIAVSLPISGGIKTLAAVVER
jgi:hypothetical protein